MEEEAKAVQELAKTGGKAIDAAREAGGFIAKYISGSLEEAIGIFEDKLKYLRWERQQRLFKRADEFLKRSGISGPSRPVPLKLAIPILQGATLEEDDLLQDRWAALLVNAANASFDGEIRRSYMSILEQLTPLDARILDVIYAAPLDEKYDGLVTAHLPDRTYLPEAEADESALPSESVVISLSNLSRLGCLRLPGTWGGGESFRRVHTTIAGRSFMRACQVPESTTDAC